jgi:hypothetical protein
MAVTFFAAATVQLMPSSMALADMAVSADMGSGCDQPKPPCPDQTPSCIDHFGCLTVPALPFTPTSLAVPFRWTVVSYESGDQPLLGLSVKPELTPPIPTV